MKMFPIYLRYLIIVHIHSQDLHILKLLDVLKINVITNSIFNV